jgi:DNA-binding response OmpR family regulator
VLLRDYLQFSGFDVDVYFSPEEASENFKGGQYSLAVLDVLMTGIDGFELYKRFSNIDNSVRACFLTGCQIDPSMFTELPDNKTKIVRKPIHLWKLNDVIRTLLNDNNQ